MENPQNTGNQYFISMTDMLLGLLIIFLVIVGYLAISFSQSLDRARNADEAEIRAANAAQAKLDLTQVAIRCRTGRIKCNSRAIRCCSVGNWQIRFSYSRRRCSGAAGS